MIVPEEHSTEPETKKWLGMSSIHGKNTYLLYTLPLSDTLKVSSLEKPLKVTTIPIPVTEDQLQMK